MSPNVDKQGQKITTHAHPLTDTRISLNIVCDFPCKDTPIFVIPPAKTGFICLISGKLVFELKQVYAS